MGGSELADREIEAIRALKDLYDKILQTEIPEPYVHRLGITHYREPEIPPPYVHRPQITKDEEYQREKRERWEERRRQRRERKEERNRRFASMLEYMYYRLGGVTFKTVERLGVDVRMSIRGRVSAYRDTWSYLGGVWGSIRRYIESLGGPPKPRPRFGPIKDPRRYTHPMLGPKNVPYIVLYRAIVGRGAYTPTEKRYSDKVEVYIRKYVVANPGEFPIDWYSLDEYIGKGMGVIESWRSKIEEERAIEDRVREERARKVMAIEEKYRKDREAREEERAGQEVYQRGRGFDTSHDDMGTERRREELREELEEREEDVIMPGLRRLKDSFDSLLDRGGYEYTDSYSQYYNDYIRGVKDRAGVLGRGIRGKYESVIDGITWVRRSIQSGSRVDEKGEVGDAPPVIKGHRVRKRVE